MSVNEFGTPALSEQAPGYVCPFCHKDCSPIAGASCQHLLLVDGENGWRFGTVSQRLYDSATASSTTLFRDLLYHNPDCRALLKLQRANYDDSLEIYVFSHDLSATATAFDAAIAAASSNA